MNTQDDRTRLVLGSASPRRRELLAQIGLVAEVIPADIDETPQPDEAAEDYVVRMAREKARAVAAKATGIVLAADTAVVLDRIILGKPRDRGDALQMLQRLSDRTHQVLSAVAVTDGNTISHALSITDVTFGPLPESVAAAYWKSGEPADKAGAYGIQGLAAVFVRRIEGSYSGVVGLPLYETAGLLSQFGVADGLTSRVTMTR